MLVMRPCTSTRIQGNSPSLVRTEYSVYWTDVAWLGMTNPSSTNSRAGCRPQMGNERKETFTGWRPSDPASQTIVRVGWTKRLILVDLGRSDTSQRGIAPALW